MAIRPGEYNQDLVVGYPGQIADMFSAQIGSYINSGGDVAQVARVALGSATTSSAYVLTFNLPTGVSASVSASSVTLTTALTSLVNAVNANADVYGAAYAAASGTDALTITARQAGSVGSFTVVASEGTNTYSATQSLVAAADSSLIPDGRVVSRAGTGRGVVLGGATEDVVGISVRTLSQEQSGTVSGTAANQYVNVARIASIYVESATAVNGQDDIVRYVTATGVITTETGVAGTAILNGARFETTCPASGIAKLRYNQGGIA